jgi:hypothetical protein
MDGHLAGAQFLDDRSRLLLGRFAALLRVNRLEHVGHVADLACRHVAEDIAVKMHDTPLPAASLPRVSKPYGVRAAGRIRLSRCHPNRVQANRGF